MAKIIGWLCVIGVICTAGFMLWQQHEAEEKLQRDVVDLRQRHTGLERQEAENRRLAAALPDPTQLERLRADHAAIPRLRGEIDALRANLQRATSVASGLGRFDEGSRVPAAEWKNAGTATARATLETVLWAAAGGDVDTFAKSVMLPDASARKQALALLESLPSELRESYGTPERLVAFLAIKDVPLGTAEIVGWTERKAATPTMTVDMQLSGPDGQPRDVVLRFSQEGTDWKLVVPSMAFAKYRVLLAQKAAATSAPASTTNK